MSQGAVIFCTLVMLTVYKKHSTLWHSKVISAVIVVQCRSSVIILTLSNRSKRFFTLITLMNYWIFEFSLNYWINNVDCLQFDGALGQTAAHCNYDKRSISGVLVDGCVIWQINVKNLISALEVNIFHCKMRLTMWKTWADWRRQSATFEQVNETWSIKCRVIRLLHVC